jgi:hypothetical protein
LVELKDLLRSTQIAISVFSVNNFWELDTGSATNKNILGKIYTTLDANAYTVYNPILIRF